MYNDDSEIFLADGEPQDISEDYYVRTLEAVGSFEQDALWDPFPRSERSEIARQLYRKITAARQRASYWLAKPFEEHGAGTNRESVLWRHNTRSYGNATSVRDPSLRKMVRADDGRIIQDGWEMVFDQFRGREYVRYRNVLDSLQDALYRVIDPSFSYVQGGHRTVLRVGRMFVGWDDSAWRKYVDGLLARMNRYVEEDQVATAQIPGFVWAPADSDHFQVGREGKRIQGGAQHYTAGTNSLLWLQRTSKPEVSVHFLIRHNPTLQERGWQLVLIENRAWTTAYANPYTVAIEFEHLEGQEISDLAYEVMAQTWADIDAYLDARPHLGNIDFVAGHKYWVANPSLICPDGIDVARINKRFNELRSPAKPPVPVRNPLDVWSATPDPWHADNPYTGKIGRPVFWVEDRFLSKIRADFMRYGYVISEAFLEQDNRGVPRLVQYTERMRLEIQPNGSYSEGLTGLESLQARYPFRAIA